MITTKLSTIGTNQLFQKVAEINLRLSTIKLTLVQHSGKLNEGGGLFSLYINENKRLTEALYDYVTGDEINRGLEVFLWGLRLGKTARQSD